jgi:hypothetical protein
MRAKLEAALTAVAGGGACASDITAIAVCKSRNVFVCN